MNVPSAVHQVEALGFRLEVEGGLVYVEPASKMDEACFEWLRRHKREVRDYLLARATFQRQCLGSLTLGRAGLWE